MDIHGFLGSDLKPDQLPWSYPYPEIWIVFVKQRCCKTAIQFLMFFLIVDKTHIERDLFV